MNCPNCGAPIPTAHTLCIRCGASIGPAAQQSGRTLATSNSRRWLPVISGLCALAVVALVAAIIAVVVARQPPGRAAIRTDSQPRVPGTRVDPPQVPESNNSNTSGLTSAGAIIVTGKSLGPANIGDHAEAAVAQLTEILGEPTTAESTMIGSDCGWFGNEPEFRWMWEGVNVLALDHGSGLVIETFSVTDSITTPAQTDHGLAIGAPESEVATRYKSSEVAAFHTPTLDVDGYDETASGLQIIVSDGAISRLGVGPMMCE